MPMGTGNLAVKAGVNNYIWDVLTIWGLKSLCKMASSRKRLLQGQLKENNIYLQIKEPEKTTFSG